LRRGRGLAWPGGFGVASYNSLIALIFSRSFLSLSFRRSSSMIFLVKYSSMSLQRLVASSGYSSKCRSSSSSNSRSKSLSNVTPTSIILMPVGASMRQPPGPGAPSAEGNFRSGGSLSPLMGPGPILDPLAPTWLRGPGRGGPWGREPLVTLVRHAKIRSLDWWL